MKAIHIKLTTIEDVYTLVKILMAFDSEVDLESGRYTVDGRSLLGIFSLDLTKPVKLIFHDESKADEHFALLGKYVVDAPEAEASPRQLKSSPEAQGELRGILVWLICHREHQTQDTA